MLEIKNLYVEGKGHAQLLRGVSFSMKLGECIGLTGPSGAGKTTIIKAIMGVLDHTCRIPFGDILLDGVSLPAMPPAKRRDLCGTTLGFIPQNPMTAFDSHIRMGRLMEETFCLRLNCSKAEARKLAADTLQKVNLLDVDRVLSSYPTQLSGGMLQRVTMAILWAMRPKYILADEPTSALDEANRDLLLQLLKDYPEPCGILFLSHDTAALTALCGEIMVLEQGQIIERAAADELFQRPKANWTKQFAAASKVRKGGGWEWTAS